MLGFPVASSVSGADTEFSDIYWSTIHSLESHLVSQKPQDKILNCFINGIPEGLVDMSDLVEHLLTLCGPLLRWKRILGPQNKAKSKLTLLQSFSII